MKTKEESILVVDDEEAIRRLLKESLSSEGYNCQEANGAEQAMAALRSNPAALVLLDIKMPAKPGTELLPEITASYPDTAVIMATVMTDTATAVECMKKGAYDYITKPFSLDELVLNVERALERRGLRLENRDYQQHLEQKVEELAKVNTQLRTEITKRKRAEAEKEELERQAQAASRLAAVGRMASGIAHEINNPLAAMINYADLLLEAEIPEDVKRDARVVHKEAERVASIVKRMLTFARKQTAEQEYVNIDDIIESTLALKAYDLRVNNINVIKQLAPDLPPTMASGSQLQQVFLNIIMNAETAMESAHGRGKLFVKTERVDNTIRISFKDDGPGIAKENLNKIFDPFFTTREVGKGTGLGLSVCHGIIAEHKGLIYAKSKLGKGATFIVELPIVTEDKQLGFPETAVNETKKVAKARILIVDDEPVVCQLLSKLLTDEGHEVETTDNASDVLERIQSERYGLILLDIKLPGTSGINLYKLIQQRDKSLARRVVFITGDVMGADTRSFLSRTKASFVTKPFSLKQLKKKIDHVLGESV